MSNKRWYNIQIPANKLADCVAALDVVLHHRNAWQLRGDESKAALQLRAEISAKLDYETMVARMNLEERRE